MTGGIRLAALLAFAAVSALVAFSSARDTALAAPTFGPGGVICFENYNATDYHPDGNVRDTGECDGDPSPGAATDTRVKFCIGWNDDCTALDAPVTDSNFGGVRGFIPAPAVIKPSDQYPVGALVGALSSDAVLGVLGGPCNLPIPVQFALMNGSTNIDDTIPVKKIGAVDVMEPLARDADNNGIPDGADKYPRFLRSQFDIDHDSGPDGIPDTSETPTSDDVNGPIPPLKPIVRLFGATKIYSMWVTLNLLVFEPGVTVLGPDRKPLELNKDLGFPTVVVLQDPTVPLAVGAISDFCAPLRVRFVTFGLTRDNPCTGGLDTASTRGNCPSEFDTALENLGYPLLPCEISNSIDEDQDGKINDGCPQVGAVAETGAECDDAISNDTEDSSINDGCPTVGEPEGNYIGTGCSAGGNEGGCEARKNSAQAGTIPVPIGTQSLRDADNDGIDNTLDVCSLAPNPDWDARFPASPANPNPQDPDNDGLPTACDPQPDDNCPRGVTPPCSPNSPTGCEKGIVGPDFDQDCYANRADNCPTASQLKDPSKPASFTQGNPQPNDNVAQIFDKDNDGIGDACDITSCEEKPGYPKADCDKFGVSQLGTAADGVGSQDGSFTVDCVTFQVTVGVGAPTRASGPVHNTDPGCMNAFGSPVAPTDPGGTGSTVGTGGTGGGAGGGTGAGGVGGPVTGIGSLSPVAGSIPAWAAVIGGLGVAGVLGSLGILGSRFVRRRD